MLVCEYFVLNHFIHTFSVSILVLVDVGLRVSKIFCFVFDSFVSILVLVDVGLRAGYLRDDTIF